MSNKQQDASVIIMQGDCRDVLKKIPKKSINCCVTSPPYFGLRDYGHVGQIGLEKTPDEYVSQMVSVFRDVRNVLRDDGTLWLNLGDSYAANRGYQVEQIKGGPKHGPAQAVNGRSQNASEYGVKPKDLIGIPWRVAFALQSDGWWLRQDIIWHKPNPMPESVTDRCTKSHEYIFLMSKSSRYYFDANAIKEQAQHPKMVYRSSRKSTEQEHAFFGNAPTNLGRCGTHDDGMRNRRSVWTVATKPYRGAHFATFPAKLIEPCILAGCPEGGTVLDPFGGSGTTGEVASGNGRRAILIELNQQYARLANERCGLFCSVSTQNQD